MALSTSDLANMQAAAKELMTATAVITRLTKTSDGAGGFTEAWVPSGTVFCRKVPFGVIRRFNQLTERVIADKLANRMGWAVTTPALTDVTVKDRVTIDGGTFEVAYVGGPRTDEVTRQLVIVEVV